MCVPANKRYQHEYGKLKTKMKRMEKRKQKSIDDIRENIKRSSKKELSIIPKEGKLETIEELMQWSNDTNRVFDGCNPKYLTTDKFYLDKPIEDKIKQLYLYTKQK